MAFGSEGNPLQQLHPFRPFVHWYNTYQMNRHISPIVDAHFRSLKSSSESGDAPSEIVRSKSIIDLALLVYLRENSNVSSSDAVNPNFKEMLINQIKLFLFSGHDTTSSTVCYILYLLSIHANVLSGIKAEHHDILGPHPFQAAALISQDPFLLNRLPYTTAVIKESMRLFPAASTTRRGEPGFTITDPRNGLQYPSDPSTLIWLVSHGCHHDPAFWPRASEFLPERWLAKEGEYLYPAQAAWRPFELGPRACIGKELSLVEMKIVLCLTARRFEIKAAYKELDAERDRKLKGTKSKRMYTVDGERAYQIGKGQPSELLPCRVKKVWLQP